MAQAGAGFEASTDWRYLIEKPANVYQRLLFIE
jgi:hypothetical protein